MTVRFKTVTVDHARPLHLETPRNEHDWSLIQPRHPRGAMKAIAEDK